MPCQIEPRKSVVKDVVQVRDARRKTEFEGGAAGLAATLAYPKEQKLPPAPWEVSVIDNALKDGTTEFASLYWQKDRRRFGSSANHFWEYGMRGSVGS